MGDVEIGNASAENTDAPGYEPDQTGMDPTAGAAVGARRRSALLAVGALLLYGTWAFVANLSHGAGSAAKALATQGISSFVSTFTITMAMEAAHGDHRSRLLRAIRSLLAGCGLAYALTVGLHLVMGTPELIRTVGPVMVFGTVYCAIYSIGLARMRPDPASVGDGKE